MPYVPSFPFRALRPEPSRDPWWLVSDTQVIGHAPGIITVKSCAEETLAATEARLKQATAEIRKRVLYDETILKQVDTAEARRIAPRPYDNRKPELSYPQQLAYYQGRCDEHRDWLRYFHAREDAVRNVSSPADVLGVVG